jgi:hypothetical protein
MTMHPAMKHAKHFPRVVEALTNPEDHMHEEYAAATYRLVGGAVKVTTPDDHANPEYWYQGYCFERDQSVSSGYYGAWQSHNKSVGCASSLAGMIRRIYRVIAARNSEAKASE